MLIASLFKLFNCTNRSYKGRCVYKKLFGTDGIRGRVGVFPLEDFFVFKIGYASALLLKKKHISGTVAIGIDTRISSERLARIFALGINMGGIDVCFVGIVSSPAISIIARHADNIIMGCMVSASHNPFYDNGFKFFNKNGIKFSPELESELTSIIYDIDSIKIAECCGNFFNMPELFCLYQRHIDRCIKSAQQGFHSSYKKIVIDCANGALSKIVTKLLPLELCDLTLINNCPDGCNINNNCGSECINSLSETVVRIGADIGFAFDGDGDRMVVCNEQGDIVDFNHLMALYILYHKNSKQCFKGFVSTNMINDELLAFAQHCNIKFYLSEVGDFNIYSTMNLNGLEFGGEVSGHFIFRSLNAVSDSIISLVKTIEALNFLQIKISEVQHLFALKPQKILNYYYQDYNTVRDAISSEEFNNLLQKLINNKVFVRFSGTEKCLRIVIKGVSTSDVELCVQRIAEFIGSK